MALTVILADDHQIVRQGLEALLKTEPDLQLVGQAGDGLETIALVEKHEPDILVMDLMMPKMNGWDVARQIRKRFPKTRIVILSMHSDESYIVEAVRAGVHGYVLKDSGAKHLINAIRIVAEGETCFPVPQNTIDSYLLRNGGDTDPYQLLTAREKEVLQLTVEGRTAPEISEKLFISTRTVETHRLNMMRKLNVRNLKELVRVAMQRGIVPG